MEEDNFFQKVKKAICRGHVKEFTYVDHDEQTITFRYGDLDGASIFVDSGAASLNVYSSLNRGEGKKQKTRTPRPQELIGKAEKVGRTNING